MKLIILLLLLFIISFSFADRTGIAIMQSTSNTNNVISGTVTFFSDDDDESTVTVTAEISGLSGFSGSLGMHVYTYGDITDNSGNGADQIWIGSGSSSHGCPDDNDRREGDLGSWIVSNGVISQTKTLNLLSLSGDTSVIGRAVILSDIEDPCTSNGDTGDRIAMGVIGIANEDGNDASQDANANTLVCRLQPTSFCPQCEGTVWFEDNGSSIRVTAQISGLARNSHGFHIHQYGDISNSIDGTSLGPHYNPSNNPHGLPANPNRHEGDMGNIQSYDSNNIAWYRFDNERIRSTDSIVGRGIVLHETADHGQGRGCGDTGNSGSRYATCVIGIASDDTDIPEPNTIINNNFFDVDCDIFPSFSPASYVTSNQYSYSPATGSYIPQIYVTSSSSSSSSSSNSGSSSSANSLFINISMICLLLITLF